MQTQSAYIRNRPLLIKLVIKIFLFIYFFSRQHTPKAATDLDVGMTGLGEGGIGSLILFEVVGVGARIGRWTGENAKEGMEGELGCRGREGWLQADSQACHVCVPALKCHLEGRADGRGAERAGAAGKEWRVWHCQTWRFNIAWAPVHLGTHSGHSFCLI